jgi:hypothetical protein
MKITNKLMESTVEISDVDILQVTLNQLIQFLNVIILKYNQLILKFIKIKHYILLLKNKSYIFSCLLIK